MKSTKDTYIHNINIHTYTDTQTHTYTYTYIHTYMHAGINKHQLKGHTDWVKYVTYNNDGSLLASASADNTIKIWTTTNLPTHKYAAKSTEEGSLNTYAQEQSRKSESASKDSGDIFSEDSLKCTLTGHTGVVCCVAFSPRGSKLASASWDATIMLWDVQQGMRMYMDVCV